MDLHRTPKSLLDPTVLWRVLDAADVGLLVTDPYRRILYVNEAFTRVTGYTLEEVQGRTCAFLQGPETDQEDIAFMRAALDRGVSFERVVLNYRKDGQPLWYRLKVQPLLVDGTPQYFVGVQEDYSETRAAHQELERLAYHDGLTGLKNRRTFDSDLRQLVDKGSKTVLILVDLNDFKQVNDKYGHPAGDALLQRVAICLEGATREGGAAYRLGGDEFALLIPDSHPFTLSQCREVLDCLVDEEGRQIPGAFGWAAFPEDAVDVEGVLRVADRQLYMNKVSKTRR